MSIYTEYKKRVLRNPDIKAEYDALESYGKYSSFDKIKERSDTTIFNDCINSNIKQQYAPFDKPNNDTITAMLEADHIDDPSAKRYSNIEDALRT